MTPMVVHCDRRTFFKSAALINFYHIDEEDRERERAFTVDVILLLDC